MKTSALWNNTYDIIQRWDLQLYILSIILFSVRNHLYIYAGMLLLKYLRKLLVAHTAHSRRHPSTLSLSEGQPAGTGAVRPSPYPGSKSRGQSAQMRVECVWVLLTAVIYNFSDFHLSGFIRGTVSELKPQITSSRNCLYPETTTFPLTSRALDPPLLRTPLLHPCWPPWARIMLIVCSTSILKLIRILPMHSITSQLRV